MTTSLTAGVALTRAAALARISAVRPADYARSSNAIDGAVTQLPPYITHGVVTLPEVLAGVASNHRLDVRHKFVFELGWRGFFRHVWAHQGDAILQSLHAGPLPDDAYARELPADIRRASTGVPAIDVAVHRLYATGTVQNHARMCLASYVVHLRRVHWRINSALISLRMPLAECAHRVERSRFDPPARIHVGSSRKCGAPLSIARKFAMSVMSPSSFGTSI